MADIPKWQELKGKVIWARRAGDYETAQGALLAAIDALGEDEGTTAERCVTLNTLADLYAESGDISRAIQTARLGLQLQRSIAEPQSILLGNDLMFLAMLLEETGEYREALELAQEGVLIYRSVLGENHHEAKRMSEFLDRVAKKVQLASNASPRQNSSPDE